MSSDFSHLGPSGSSRDPRIPPAAQGDRLPEQYDLRGMPHALEDIILCVDIDRQIDAEMKVTGAKGQVLARLDAIKQAILLFVYSKLMLHPQHRFAFSTIGDTAAWLQPNFSNEIETINNSVRALCSSGIFHRCDLSQLFRIAASEAKKSQLHGRLVRVVLIYCRSDVVPDYPDHLPESQRSFTFDAMYLHDKPTQYNCPQRVYDALVEALERVSLLEGYIYESGSGLSRVLFRQMCCLLSHPQQRCGQDDFEVPKDISKVGTAIEGSAGPASTKKEDDSGASHSFA